MDASPYSNLALSKSVRTYAVGVLPSAALRHAQELRYFIYYVTHLTQVQQIWEVWRAASPPISLLFPVRRRPRLRRTGKREFWGGEASPNPPLRKVSYVIRFCPRRAQKRITFN